MMAWLLCCLLNAAQSQGQEQTVRLDDLNLMLGSQPAVRQTILEKMHTFHQAHAIALSVTLLPEDDVYQAFSMAEQTRWLGQSSPALAITIWHDAKFRTYQRCQVQVNTALSKRLPPTTAQAIVSAQLRAGSQSSPARDEAMRQGLLGGLEELAAYLQALPAPNVMPAITFASAEVINTSPATGLDIFTHQAHQSNYEQVEVQGKPYAVAWKALRSGRSETVLAQVADSLSFPAAVVFEQNGNLLSAQPASAHHQQQLLLTGQAQEQQGSVEVYGSQDEQAPLLGRLNTISYDALPKKLVLVPVMKTWMAYELQDIGQQVAAIYAQAAVDMTIAYQTAPLMIEG